MTSYSHLYTSYEPSSRKQKVKIVDVSLASIAGKEFIPLSKTLSLDSTLHVPRLSCSLLLISKITKDHNFVAKLFPSYCEFQDLHTRKLICVDKEVVRLYYFENELTSSGNPSHTRSSFSSTSSNQEIDLWHKRLGHPSFSYLKRLFPTLVKRYVNCPNITEPLF